MVLQKRASACSSPPCARPSRKLVCKSFVGASVLSAGAPSRLGPRTCGRVSMAICRESPARRPGTGVLGIGLQGCPAENWLAEGSSAGFPLAEGASAGYPIAEGQSVEKSFPEGPPALCKRNSSRLALWKRETSRPTLCKRNHGRRPPLQTRFQQTHPLEARSQQTHSLQTQSQTDPRQAQPQRAHGFRDWALLWVYTTPACKR